MSNTRKKGMVEMGLDAGFQIKGGAELMYFRKFFELSDLMRDAAASVNEYTYEISPSKLGEIADKTKGILPILLSMSGRVISAVDDGEITLEEAVGELNAAKIEDALYDIGLYDGIHRSAFFYWKVTQFLTFCRFVEMSEFYNDDTVIEYWESF